MRSWLGRLVRGARAASTDPFDTDFTSDANPVIVGGVPRSGTTLMRVMLDSHHNICCGPESGLFVNIKTVRTKGLAKKFGIPQATIDEMFEQSQSRPEFIDRFFAEYCRMTGKPRWGEKTPGNLRRMDAIFRAFPNAQFIHIIRDGRDVACSLRTLPRHKVVNGELVPLNTWKPIRPIVEQWVNEIRDAQRYRRDPRYMELQYETLVHEPRATFEQVLDFLNEPWDEQVLNYHEVDSHSRRVTLNPQNPEAAQPLHTQSLGRWQRDFSDEDRAIFKEVGGPLLIELGYVDSNDW